MYLKVHNTSNGAYRWMKSPPLCMSSVFALFQQVLAPPVVWMFIKDPDALMDLS